MSITRRTVLAGLAALAAPAVLPPRPAMAQGFTRSIGSLLLVGMPGADLAAGARGLAAHIAAGNAGGAMFLGNNMTTRPAVEAAARMLRDSAPDGPALVAVDQEGGAVQRLSAALGYTPIPSALRVAATRTPTEAQALYAGMAAELAAAGFTLNLAPVADLHDPENPVIGAHSRGFSDDPETVVAYCSAFIAAHAGTGVHCAVKHFPGHGRSRGDSHEGIVDITATWGTAELEPFHLLIASGAARVVMAGHLRHDSLGAEPATLNRQAITGVLREDLGFAGVVMTDDLDMAAIRDIHSLEEAVILALAAGNDLLLLSNSLTPDPDLPAIATGWVEAAVRNGRLSGDAIEASAARLAALRAET